MASGHLTAIESRRLARRIFRFLTANASATRTSVEQSGLPVDAPRPRPKQDAASISASLNTAWPFTELRDVGS